jgi:hypothetical protein
MREKEANLRSLDVYFGEDATQFELIPFISTLTNIGPSGVRAPAQRSGH